jgi:hypothetical protein
MQSLLLLAASVVASCRNQGGRVCNDGRLRPLCAAVYGAFVLWQGLLQWLPAHEPVLAAGQVHHSLFPLAQAHVSRVAGCCPLALGRIRGADMIRCRRGSRMRRHLGWTKICDFHLSYMEQISSHAL